MAIDAAGQDPASLRIDVFFTRRQIFCDRRDHAIFNTNISVIRFICSTDTTVADRDIKISCGAHHPFSLKQGVLALLGLRRSWLGLDGLSAARSGR